METVIRANRILLLTPATGYRAEAFLDAAVRLGLDVIQGVDEKRLGRDGRGHRIFWSGSSFLMPSSRGILSDSGVR